MSELKTKKNDRRQPAEVKPVRIESVAQLKAMIDAPCLCRVLVDGAPVEIPVGRLSVATSERIRGLYRKAKPPFNKLLAGGQGGYDEQDPKYLAERDLNTDMARSVVIYAHCPLVAAQKPGLMDEAQIHAFVKELLPDVVLEALALTIRASGTQLDLQERVNFTSRSGSES